MSLAAELIDGWAPLLISVSLKTADKGRFLVTCDATVVFDKGAEGRHARPGEVVERLLPLLGPKLTWR